MAVKKFSFHPALDALPFGYFPPENDGRSALHWHTPLLNSCQAWQWRFIIDLVGTHLNIFMHVASPVTRQLQPL